MSLINHVLNELERRGTNTPSNQTLIRAVPQRLERRWIKPIIVIIVVLVVVLIAVLWILKYRSDVEGAKALLAEPASKLSLELSVIPVPVQTVSRTRNAEVDANPNRLAYDSPSASLDAPIKLVSRSQQADAEYRKAYVLQQQGHSAQAMSGYKEALQLNAQHELARISLAAMLMENMLGDDAENLLIEGLKLKPKSTNFSMAIARIEVELGKTESAIESLRQNLESASERADYQAFYAALLQRQGRHKEAVAYYEIANHLAPRTGAWLMGYGLSLQELLRKEDAKIAYQQALDSQTLSPELSAFVQQKIKGL